MSELGELESLLLWSFSWKEQGIRSVMLFYLHVNDRLQKRNIKNIAIHIPGLYPLLRLPKTYQTVSCIPRGKLSEEGFLRPLARRLIGMGSPHPHVRKKLLEELFVERMEKGRVVEDTHYL